MSADPFAAYASQYDAALAQGLEVSGEGKDYFARGRLAYLRGRLRSLGFWAGRVVDFGCGTGSTMPLFRELLGSQEMLGLEPSEGLLARARTEYGELAEFASPGTYEPQGSLDLAFCNGVFHHIPPPGRPEAVRYVLRCLRPGGLFAFWENNPWNPGTRLVMSRIPFDRDAITLTPPEARALLKSAGFEVVHTRFLFIFPRPLKLFRFLEPYLARWPLGAQYQVLCRKPLRSTVDS